MIALPSKKVLSVIIVVAALVIAVIVAFGRDKASSAINYTSTLVAGDKISIPENQNWKGEVGNITTGAEAPKEESGTTGETLTDVVSRSLVSNYLALKQSGTLDSDSAQKLVEQTISYVSETDQINQITQLNLNVIPDNGSQTMIAYGENLGSILKKDRPKEGKNELEILGTTINSGNQEKISELDSVIYTYEKIIRELIKMSVPKTFVKAHLDMTNGAIGIALSLREIKTVFSDPFRSLIAIQKYQESASVFVQAIRATSVFINKNNIIYEQGSGGYYLLYGL